MTEKSAPREKMDFAEKLAFDMWASTQYPRSNGCIENWLSHLYQKKEKENYRVMAKLALKCLAAQTDEALEALAVHLANKYGYMPVLTLAQSDRPTVWRKDAKEVLAKILPIFAARAAQEQKELAVVLARKEERIAIGTELERVLTQINSPKVNKKIVETLKCGQALRSDKG